MIDPKHLEAVIQEVQRNYKVPIVEKAYMVKALGNQREFKLVTKEEKEAILKEIEESMKTEDMEYEVEVPAPKFEETYGYIEKMASKIFVFLSRHEIESLKVIGKISEKLVEMVVEDLKQFTLKMKNQ